MRTFTVLVMALVLGVVGFLIYQTKFYNPEVARELRAQPDGQRAERVMLMTVDDGKTMPVNYLHEGDQVFVGADGPWWREMQGNGQPVALLIKGKIYSGQARAVTDRPEYRREIFERLRPDVPDWLPEWLRGVLIVIDVEAVE